ncbi:unnamed protein product [Prorocentrum cordatum]|uniref:non-specific serine/threonine protein kinase n=1 Tax=Prorocentrum cordatum TaxID=2364126 RepID=A0ABN9SXK5_9DINO|nr:unnamed protein product [Polarella glacialis]
MASAVAAYSLHCGSLGGHEVAHAGAAAADVEASADPAALHELYQKFLRHGAIAGEALSAPGDRVVPERGAGAAAPTGGAPLVPGPPSRFEQDFERLELLGRGAFGEVWRCRHRLDGHEYAVKMVQFRSRASDGDRLRQRVAREVEVQASLAHPGIVRYHTSWVEGHWACSEGPRAHGSRPRHVVEAVGGASSASPSFREESEESGVVFGEASSAGTVELEPLPPVEIVPACGEPEFCATLYIQSELCSKDTLHSWIAQRNAAFASGQLTEEQREQWQRQACRIFAQVADAVAHLHAQACVHRDLKPANILFGRDGGARVADFGLARGSSRELGGRAALSAGRAAGRAGALPRTRAVGTPAYASPEQLAGMAARPAGDVYSLGVVLAELLCPVQTQMERAKLIEGLRSSGQLPPSVHLASPVVERMVMDMTHPKPAARPSAWEVALWAPRLCREVRRQRPAPGAWRLGVPAAGALPPAPEPPVASVALEPLLEGTPPAQLEAPEELPADEHAEGPPATLQQQIASGRSAGLAAGAQLQQDVQGQGGQIEMLGGQPKPSLRTSAGQHAPAARVLRAAPGRADVQQGLLRGACCRGRGRPAAAAAEDDGCGGDQAGEEGEAGQGQTIQVGDFLQVSRGHGGENDVFALLLLGALLCSTLVLFSAVMSLGAARRGGHLAADLPLRAGPLAWYAAQVFPFVLRMMSGPRHGADDAPAGARTRAESESVRTTREL